MSLPSSATSSPSTLFSVIRRAQPAVVLGDIVAIATRVVDCSAGPGRIVLRSVVLRLQCRQLQLGQLAQSTHVCLGQCAIGQLLAQLLQPLAGNLCLFAQRLALQRRQGTIGPLALVAEEAAATIEVRAISAGPEVATTTIGAATAATLAAGLRAALAALALLPLALLTALAAVLSGLAIARVGRLRARIAAVAAIGRARLCLRALGLAHLRAGPRCALCVLCSGAAHLALQFLQPGLDLPLVLRQSLGLLVAQATALLCARSRNARRGLRGQCAT